MTSLPRRGEAARLICFLQGHPRWSAFWDKAYGVWRVAEDDPDSSLYVASADVGIVLGYMMRHAL